MDVEYDPDKFPFNLIDNSDIENGLSDVSKYGVGLSEYIDNPILQFVGNKAIEAAANAGYGPMLALARFALSLGDEGNQVDPIAEAVRVILARIQEAEERIILRVEGIEQEKAREQFEGLSQLYAIFNTANTIEKRATLGYASRLYTVDNNLDTLIAYFEGDIFRGAHVKNYQVYVQIVALRLLVLAEVERLALYELYGPDLSDHFDEYNATLKRQYQIVLDGVFDHINNNLAESNEWRIESDKRFSGTTRYQNFETGKNGIGGRPPQGRVSYTNRVRPLLWPLEQDHYDQLASSERDPDDLHMSFTNVKYFFSDIQHNIHLTGPNYGSTRLGEEKFSSFPREICVSTRYNQCNQAQITKNAQNRFLKSEISYHKDRAYYQFIDIYYRPTQRILDRWWGLYHSTNDPRPKNKLDLMVDEMK